ncbi:MAG: hydroxyethylthiazole kinase [Paludibacteraceae bacterium]|nr:hydroxyethylthiazole kinase [Paludibacteraceae bacterium]
MKHQPIILCITNYVAVEFTANVLLAVGARPLMSYAIEEMPDLANAADALLINIGTLDNDLIRTALCAGETMRALGKPIVLDPVGVQVSNYRKQAALDIISRCEPNVIKGNTSEMAVLSSLLSPSPQRIFVTTGETDLITDGVRQERLSGGAPLQTQVTAMGCVAGALIAAYAAKGYEAFDASIRAMTLMNTAGKEAEGDYGLGTYRTRFIDCLSHYA